jgi:hypothetical protein
LVVGERGLDKRLVFALRLQGLIPDGAPSKEDEFLEFSKDHLRRDGVIAHRSGEPDLREIGAHAEAFMCALYKAPLRKTAPKRRRLVPAKYLSPVLIGNGLGLSDLYRARKHISVSITTSLRESASARRCWGV